MLKQTWTQAIFKDTFTLSLATFAIRIIYTYKQTNGIAHKGFLLSFESFREREST